MDSNWKARSVKDGHLTPDLEDSKYAGVVSREIARIALNYTDLHQTQVLSTDIRNAYPQATRYEKHYIIR